VSRVRIAVAAWLVLLVAVPLAGEAARGDISVTWHPARPRVGDVAWVYVKGGSPHATVEGAAAGRPLAFFIHGGGHAAVVGVDLETKPGSHPWSIAVVEPRLPPRLARGRLDIRPRPFRTQNLTLPTAMVDLDPAATERAQAEGEALRTVYRTITPERLWRGAFTRPVAGTEPGTGFGARRVINGKPRAPHSGIDFAAPAGTPVVAANAGRVALVGDFFFPGRLVVLDHGLGLHTLYFHLESVLVAPGDPVERGQTIGTVGATGRATGPHLHFGVQVGPARVDPATLLHLRLD
jgi:hypothetical protein